MTTEKDVQRVVFGYAPGDRIAADDLQALEDFNKCDDCCLIVGCDACGPCAEHDNTEEG